MIKRLTSILILLIGALPALAQQAKSNRETLSPELRSQVEQLERDYGIEFVLDNPGFPIEAQDNRVVRGDSASLSQLQKYLPMFIEEWRLYPSSVMRRAQLTRVIITDDLNVSGYGFVSGFCDSKNRAIFYNFFTFRLDEFEFYEKWMSVFLRVEIHHELFHFLDHRMRQDIYSDSTWEALNSPEFRYKESVYYSDEPANVTSYFGGFISPYSRASIPEDKAEIFSRMILNLHEMECRGKDDAILAKKIDYLKKVLKEFSPEMDNRFWNKIRMLNRPRLTLEGKEDPWATAHPTLPPLPKVEEPKEAITTDAVCIPRSHRPHLFHHRERQ